MTTDIYFLVEYCFATGPRYFLLSLVTKVTLHPSGQQRMCQLVIRPSVRMPSVCSLRLLPSLSLSRPLLGKQINVFSYIFSNHCIWHHLERIFSVWMPVKIFMLCIFLMCFPWSVRKCIFFGKWIVKKLWSVKVIYFLSIRCEKKFSIIPILQYYLQKYEQIFL